MKKVFKNEILEGTLDWFFLWTYGFEPWFWGLYRLKSAIWGQNQGKTGKNMHYFHKILVQKSAFVLFYIFQNTQKVFSMNSWSYFDAQLPAYRISGSNIKNTLKSAFPTKPTIENF